MGLGLRRLLEDAASKHVRIRGVLTAVHLFRANFLVIGAQHPIDRHYGVQTQSHVPLYLMKTGSPLDRDMIPYGGCVGSALRNVLDRLSPSGSDTFIDIGCGKGRALIIASEYHFAEIIGIEHNPDVAALAGKNTRRVTRRFPDRAAIEVRIGDASAPDLPAGDIIVFMYHPFGRPLVDRLCEHLAKSFESGRSITIIYKNPVHGAAFDAHTDFDRVYAAMLLCEDDERAFSFDAEEAIVVWRSSPSSLTPDDNAQRAILTVKPDYRAVLGA